MTSFLGEVLNARDMASYDEFQDTFQIVGGKISTLKTELSRALHSCFSACDADIDRVTSWHVECVGIQSETEALKSQLDINKMKSALSTDEITSLNMELNDCEINIGILKTLIEIVQNLELAEPETDFYISSKRLKKCEDVLATLVAEFRTDEDTSWIKEVEISLSDRIMENYERAMKEWNAKFRFEKNSLIVDPFRGDIAQLMDALHNLGYFKTEWERFCKQFWQELFYKACTPEYTVEFKQPTPNQVRRRSMAFNRESAAPLREIDLDSVLSPAGSGDHEGACTLYVIRLKKLDIPFKSAHSVFDNIIRLVECLFEIFNEKLETMQELGENLGPQLVYILSNKCLKTLTLQESDGDKTKAMKDLTHLRELRQKLWDLNFRIPDESSLDEFETNFDVLFMNQFRQNRLGKLRSLIRSDIHQTVQVMQEARVENDCADMDGNENGIGVFHKNPFFMQKYTISKSVATMVDILKEHFRSYPSDYMLIANTLNLFISIVVIPKHESDVKDFIPLSAVLIHNNCWFLSHHVEVSFPHNEDKIPLLRTKATQAYTFMMRTIRTKLNSMIASTMTGLNEEVEVESMKGNVAKKFLEISAEFHHLDKVFFEVLPPGILSQTLATLLDHTVNEMCSKVLSWEDISVNSANALAACFIKFAEATSSLFRKDATSVREMDALTSKVVHKWPRFRLLTFILTASMKEIQDKWLSGCGPLSVAFTPEEVRKLVRALFQNTDRRAAFLSSIK